MSTLLLKTNIAVCNLIPEHLHKECSLRSDLSCTYLE